ncbi:ATP-dependent RNA helicase DBP3 [Nymphaea colorata]|uniref:ATP-dependent RNA helicase DBP3 n=1 Tax=Nymphaea colorata TaxID=210225 RepID=UPI00129E8D0D|nr:ATP-dependent RNA helicase DBP3 [Nymphaea colorata]XP_031488846.1 ATP-dependent RNA helicase DBP3 [Nymphaea colorata]
MAKGDDAKRKKRNKALRKRMRKDAPVSARIASAIASKRRRKAGKRRICEGMCFSAPTLEDPFNERNNVKTDCGRKRRKLAHQKNDLDPLLSVHKKLPSNCKFGKVLNEDLKEKRAMSSMNIQNKSPLTAARMAEGQSIMDDQDKSTRKMVVVNGGAATQGRLYRSSDGLPKFLILCLSAIQNSWAHDGLEKSLFSNSWGSEFWKACSDGLDILGIGESCSGKEQIAWLASTFADIVTAREKEGASIDSPFLLFLVPSKERAVEVRLLFKPLKALGIHTVSIHCGASLEHQVHGLKSCEPEFLICTPGRLLELISLKSLEISHVSLLVIDGLECFVNSGIVAKLLSIRQLVSGNPQTIILSPSYGNSSFLAVQSLIKAPIKKLPLDNSVISQSMCILQLSYFCDSEDEKISKAIGLLKELQANQLPFPRHCVYIARIASEEHALVTSLRREGYSISSVSDIVLRQKSFSHINQHSDRAIAVSVVTKEEICKVDVGELETIVFVNLPTSIDEYTQVLAGMARHSVQGVLHSFYSKADASLAGPLINVLEQCQQVVPESLRLLADAHSEVGPA